jgi:uncharacterized membrane-anchored protein YhcB (DUF1043 family)
MINSEVHHSRRALSSSRAWNVTAEFGYHASMTVFLIVVIAVAAVAAIAIAASFRLRQRRAQKEMLRERISSDVAGHRQEAEAHSSRAADLGPQAEAHREEAAQHLAKADELERAADRARRFADRHGTRAEERERELEEI